MKIYKNLLKNKVITEPNQIWVTDFTYLWYKRRFIYVAVVMDLYAREIVGISILSHHSASLVVQALLSALIDHPKPEIVHQDQGSEYTGKLFRDFCNSAGIKPSFSRKGSPWENGFQESFFDKFKMDLGDPSRFETLRRTSCRNLQNYPLLQP